MSEDCHQSGGYFAPIPEIVGVRITRPCIIVGADSDARTITVLIADKPTGVMVGDVAEITYWKHEV